MDRADKCVRFNCIPQEVNVLEGHPPKISFPHSHAAAAAAHGHALADWPSPPRREVNSRYDSDETMVVRAMTESKQKLGTTIIRSDGLIGEFNGG